MTMEQSDPETVLERTGFTAADSVLTHRQAVVLVLREQGVSQADIADYLDTSRANVANIEKRARENIDKAHQTVAFVDALRAPVQVTIEPDTDIYEVPDMIYDACNEFDVKVTHPAPALMKRIVDEASTAVTGRSVIEPITISVTREGTVQIHQDTHANT